MTGNITPCLWFDTQAEEAARFYTSIFADAAIDGVSYYGENMPMPAGTAMLVQFTLRGQPFQALNGNLRSSHSEAISLSADCATQAELDHVWDGLIAGGGNAVQCGWLKDRFGVSWQVVPGAVMEMHRTGSPEQVDRMMAALMGMVKLDIATLEAAFRGD